VFALINIWQIRHSITSVTCTIQYYSNQAKYLLAYKYIIRRDLRLKIKLFTRRDLRLNTNFIQDVVCVYITNLNTNFIQGVICVKTTYQAKYLLAYKYIIRRDLRLKIKLFTRRDLRLNTNFIQGVVCVYTTNFIVYTRCGLHLLTLTTTLFIHMYLEKHKITEKSCQLLDTANKCWETIVTS
jgi:hypothetical protein